MRTRIAALFCLVAGAALAPAAGAGVSDMGSYWPNDDGVSWTYQQHFEQVFPTQGTVDNYVRLLLDGTTVAPNAIDAQRLRGEVVAGPTVQDAGSEAVAGGFLGYLWRARPDLRGALEGRILASGSGPGPCPSDAPLGFHAALLSGEFAFRKTLDEIAAWRCNLADTRSWLWLVSNLTIGSTFEIPLIPDIASDVRLHGRIAAFEDVTVPVGSFASCLRVDYVVDYGTSACTDQNGNEIGTFRSETRGYVHYASGVGPVQSFEEFIPYAAMTGECAPPEDVGRVGSTASMRLSSGPVPTAPSTWGRVKAIYR